MNPTNWQGRQQDEMWGAQRLVQDVHRQGGGGDLCI
jgi:hypothetical protein